MVIFDYEGQTSQEKGEWGVHGEGGWGGVEIMPDRSKHHNDYSCQSGILVHITCTLCFPCALHQPVKCI